MILSNSTALAALRRAWPVPLRDVLFALFIVGILAYGIGVAWYMLARFDLGNLLRDANYDDSFYYFQIARNLAEGKFSTFDGGITRTNGYHPIWMLLIVPLYWMVDAETALFAIKALELMLIAGGVALIALAARAARLPWILLFAALPILYVHGWQTLFHGTEAAAALFMLGLLFLSMAGFARYPVRWTYPLAAVAFALPWVRLEFAAVSVAATAMLFLVERRARKNLPCAAPAFRAFVPLLSACSGVLVYFAYNWLVFGGAVPVSGVTKQIWSQNHWQKEGGYSFAQNFKDILQIPSFADGLAVALGILVCVLLVLWSTRRVCERDDRLLLIFLAAAFGLAAGHAAKFLQTVLTMDQIWGSRPHYFVLASLMKVLIIPIACYVALHLVRRLAAPGLGAAAGTVRLGIIAAGAAVLLVQTDFADMFRQIDSRSESSQRDWEIASYQSVQVMNRVLPGHSVIGSWSAGVIGYFSRFPVVNLDGLVNSYDYMRARRAGTSAEFREQFGITHFADAGPGGPGKSNATLFAGHPFLQASGKRDLQIRLWSAVPMEESSAAFDADAWFWEQMAPHWDYRSDAVAVVVDGNMAQAFFEDHALAETRNEPLAFSWVTGNEKQFRVWRFWADTDEIDRGGGVLTGVLELPNDVGHPIHIAQIATLPADSIVHGQVYSGAQAMARFEDGSDGYHAEGDAFTNHRGHERYKGQQPVVGNVGGFLTSFHPGKGDRATGRAVSPDFVAEPGQFLAFLIAGGAGKGVGVRLLADGREVMVWRGENTERFRQIVHPLNEVVGRSLQLELFDDETGGWGHIMLDEVALVRRGADAFQ